MRLVALALLAFLGACSAYGERPPDNVILQQSGDGAFTSQSFETYGPWALQWETSSLGSVILVTDETNGVTQVVASLPGEGYWRSEVAGRHSVQVAATGPWALRVTKLSR